MANFYNRKSEAAWWWTGDVVWPASATDSNFAAFDTTTGKLIKDSTKNSASFAPALGADDNYVTDAEKTAIGTISGKEDVSNKENTTLDTSTTKYPTNRLVKEYADGLVVWILGGGWFKNISSTTYNELWQLSSFDGDGVVYSITYVSDWRFSTITNWTNIWTATYDPNWIFIWLVES